MKNELNKATIESLSHDGKGIARINNKTTFIRNALPGEEVNFTYTKKHGKYDMGDAVEILKDSPDRIEPECKHYGICGGCTLQHLDHQKQLAFKTQVLLDHLKHIGSIEINTLDPRVKPEDDNCKLDQNPMLITGPTYGYRSKARLSAKYVQKKQKMLVGFHEKNGRFVADTDECPVLHSSIGKKISELAELIASLSIYQHIPQIEVACGDTVNALVLRNLQNFTDSDLEILKKFGEENNISFYSQSGGLDTVKPMFPGEKLTYKLPDHEIEITFVPTDFTQINRDINKKLVNLALDLLDPQPNEKILDLFCGIGNFTLPIAKKCSGVTGVEGSKSSIERAEQNAKNNNIENADFYCCDLTKELSLNDWSKQQYDKILFDPPRTGALEICDQIKQFNPKKIVYVSCNPATLARDAKTLVEHGYKLESITLLDMYPQTSHMEVVARFLIH